MSQQFIKLLLIGDSGVGKSCILTRFCQNTFSSAFFNTIGVDFKTKQVVINNVKCKMQIWDTAGQQRFRTITANYYRGANGILVVFDVTSKASFKNVDFWLGEIQKHGNNKIMTILVGNKCDFVGKREVQEEQANAFAKERNLLYIEASALNASNVNLLFETIGKNILQSKGHSQTTKQTNKDSKPETKQLQGKTTSTNFFSKCC